MILWSPSVVQVQPLLCLSGIFAQQVISIFAAVGVLFIPVGAVCLAEALSVRPSLDHARIQTFHTFPDLRRLPIYLSLQVVEVVQRYDDVCAAGATPALREATLQQVGAFELLPSAQIILTYWHMSS